MARERSAAAAAERSSVAAVREWLTIARPSSTCGKEVSTTPRYTLPASSSAACACAIWALRLPASNKDSNKEGPIAQNLSGAVSQLPAAVDWYPAVALSVIAGK